LPTDWLRAAGLTDQTIARHVDNIDLVISRMDGGFIVTMGQSKAVLKNGNRPMILNNKYWTIWDSLATLNSWMKSLPKRND
jgi:hypothetical protein